MRFLVDVCAGPRLAAWLREAGHDVLDASLAFSGSSDSEILACAFEQRRIVVTLDQDFCTMVYRDGAAHAGLVRLPDVRTPERIALLDRILRLHERDLGNAAIVICNGRRLRVTMPSGEERLDGV